MSLAAAAATTPEQAPLPNIMVFLVDDMGVMDTSVAFLTDVAGEPKRHPLNAFYRTPAMEQLAERGVRFNQFYAMSVCSPTRISIMTGQNAARHRATNWINPTRDNAGPLGAAGWNWVGLKKDDITLPGVLRESGYKTIHVGKAHFGPMEHDGEDPLNLGFDVNVAGHSWGAPSSYYGEKNYGHGTERARNAVPHLQRYHGTDTFLSEALTLEAKKQVAEAVASDQPFFLHFSHYAVHSPFDSDPRFAAHYKDSGKPPAAQAFATLIEGIDKSLGDMLDQFEELGVADNTLVVFLGDNGTDAPLGKAHDIACAAPLRGKKGAHYEGGMRVPFIAAWAGADPDNPWQAKLPITAGALQSQAANVTDLFPTLLALAGAETPAGHEVDGHSLATLFTGAADVSRPEQFLMHYPHGQHRSSYFTTWRDGDWKLIYHYHAPADKRCELFNLAQDPSESRNLAAERPAECRRMLEAMVAALEDAGAQYPRALADGKTPQRPEWSDF